LVAALKMRDPLERKGSIIFWSVLDHGVLARHPFYPDAPRESGHIPMIIGNTHDETRAFLGGDPKNFALTWEELPARLEARAGAGHVAGISRAATASSIRTTRRRTCSSPPPPPGAPGRAT
jgi:carboxylesterase type B